MLKLAEKHFSKEFNYGIWFLMAFQAGYVNVGAFYTSDNYVSHVTGTSSNIGMTLAEGNWILLSQFVLTLLSFILGASISGYLIGEKILQGKRPQYVLAVGIKTLTFGMATILSYYYITPEHDKFWQVGFEIIPLLSVSCGLQNSICSISSNGFLKPTHMTGLSTDLGIGMAQLRFYKKKSVIQYKEERLKVILRTMILFSFIAGGFISMSIFKVKGGLGFLFPFFSSLCFFAYAIISELKREHLMVVRTFKFAVFGVLLITVTSGVAFLIPSAG